MGSAGAILVVDDGLGVRDALETTLAARWQSGEATTTSADLGAAAWRSEFILGDDRLPELFGTSTFHATKRFFPSTLRILMAKIGAREGLRHGTSRRSRREAVC